MKIFRGAKFSRLTVTIWTSVWRVSCVRSTTKYQESQVSGEPGIRRARYQESQVSGEPGIRRARYQESPVLLAVYSLDPRGVWTCTHTYSLIITVYSYFLQ